MTTTWCVRGAAGLLLTLAACVGGAAAPQDKKTVTLTEKDNDGKIKLSKGDTVVLKLPVQGGTGFTWVLVKNDKDQIKQVGKEETEKPEKPLPGARVMRVWRFSAEAAGATALELHYKRTFEKDKAPAKTFKVNLTVE